MPTGVNIPMNNDEPAPDMKGEVIASGDATPSTRGVLIHQALCGYLPSRGHGLIECSVKLTDNEKHILNVCTDLGGYMRGSFESYLSGMPCGRFYALMCTWHDEVGERGGCVHTHVLLIPGDLGTEYDNLLYDREMLFRRPTSPTDSIAYTCDLTYRGTKGHQWTHEIAHADGETSKSIAMMASAFMPPVHPRIWVSERQPIHELCREWRQRNNMGRNVFTFTTYALNDSLDVNGNDYDFYAVHPAAVNNLHRFATQFGALWVRQTDDDFEHWVVH